MRRKEKKGKMRRNRKMKDEKKREKGRMRRKEKKELSLIHI